MEWNGMEGYHEFGTLVPCLVRSMLVEDYYFSDLLFWLRYRGFIYIASSFRFRVLANRSVKFVSFFDVLAPSSRRGNSLVR